MAGNDKAQEPRGQIPTNLRLLLVIEEVARVGGGITASDLSGALDLPKPTVHRLLATAEQEGFVQRDVDARSYGPGRRLRRLAGNTLSSQRVRTERLAIMKALADRVGETCNLAAPGRHGMHYLDRVETHWPLRIQLPVGTQVPFHCTASGKLYLASLRPARLERLLATLPLERQTAQTLVAVAPLRDELAETRMRGFSTDNQEFMENMAAVAVPIRDTAGRLVSTLSIHAPIQRHGIDSLIAQLPDVQRAAAALEALIED